jgi:hypothetical protein
VELRKRMGMREEQLTGCSAVQVRGESSLAANIIRTCCTGKNPEG